MSTSVAADAGGLPEDVEVTSTPREPVSDPTLGIRVPVTPSGSPPHRLVAIGDSLFQGFQSGAVYHTDLSVPAILAEELGVLERFRYPRYGGMGGLPVNIELLVRDLEERFGENVDLWEVPLALFRARQWMDEVEDYWERGPGSLIPQLTGINKQPRNARLGSARRPRPDRGTLSRAAARSEGRPRPADGGERQRAGGAPCLPDGPRTGPVADAVRRGGATGRPDRRCGPRDRDAAGVPRRQQRVVDRDPASGGVECGRVRRPGPQGGFTIWRPVHFIAELQRVASRVRAISARHVVWCTVPHERRYIDDPLARPPWWQPYPVPPELAALTPVPDSRFLTGDGRGGRATGGLFSLDGVHPTTVGYGILAQELIRVMRRAGVEFRFPDGSTPRPDPVTVDFDRLLRRDALVSRPPQNLRAGLRLLGWGDEALDLVRRALPF